jgi:hypothetical protein
MTPRPRQAGHGLGRPRVSLSFCFPLPRHLGQSFPDGRGRLLLRRGDTNRCSHIRTHGSRIRQGSDEFVNYCVNHNRTLHSNGGRLFCWAYHDPAHNEITNLKSSRA